MSDPDPKHIVPRLLDEAMNEATSRRSKRSTHPDWRRARGWVEPFLASFSDVRKRIVELVAEGETVVARFACSGTHSGNWHGHPATGRRFTNVAELYFFRVVDGHIVRAWGLEDTADRSRQLGLPLS